jgi:hypothetical protein
MKFADVDDVPRDVRAVYFSQRAQAKRNSDGWNIALLDFANWWFEDDRWIFRGRKKNDLRMIRLDTSGPYSVANIMCSTNSGRHIANPNDRLPEIGSEGPWSGKSGDDHPRSRAVITPQGRFGSAAEAAAHFGKARQLIARWAKSGKNGFRYENETD